MIVLEVDAAEEGQIGEIGGNLTGEAIRTKTEYTKLSEFTDCSRWDTTDKTNGG